MQHRSNVSPVPLPVERESDRIRLTYLDGRVVTYRGPFDDRDGGVRANRSFAVHVLVVDPESEEGVMTYINDYDTSDDILESTGVGRVLLAEGESEAIYPGVTARLSGETIDVRVHSAVGQVNVYAFVENDRGESAVKLTGSGTSL